MSDVPVPTPVVENNVVTNETSDVAPKAAPPTPPKKFKVKVDEQESEVDEAELLKGYQSSKAANKRFQEAAQLRKQAEEFITLLKSDPVKVLKDPRLGHDVRKLAEEYLVAELQHEMLSPAERELKSLKTEKAEREAREAEGKKAEEAKLEEELTGKFVSDYTAQFTDALKESKLPKTPSTIKRMAYYMQQSLKKGVELKASEAANLVRKDYIGEVKEIFGDMDGAALLELLGPDVSGKIRKSDLAQLKNPVPVESERHHATKPTQRKKALTPAEWRAKLDKLT